MTETIKQRRHRVGFLPLPLLVGPEIGVWEFHRAVALVVLLVTIGGLAAVWALILSCMHLFFGFRLVIEISIALLVAVIMLLQLWLFYRYKRLRLSANLLAYSYFLITLVLVMIGGGYDSPISLFLFCCIIITFRIADRTDGIMNAFFVLLAGAALALMKKLEIDTPNLLLGLYPEMIFAVVWLVTLVIFAACLATYHHPQRDPVEESR